MGHNGMVLPLCDVIPARAVPWATLTLIALIGLASAGSALALWPVAAGREPTSVAWIPAVAQTATVLFLPASALSAIGNGWALWLFGGSVEGQLGPWRLLSCYLLFGLAAVLGEGFVQTRGLTWWASSVPGASGPVAGVLATYLVLFPRARVLTWVPFSASPLPEISLSYVMAGWLLLQVGATGRTGLSLTPIGAAALAGLAVGLLARRRLARFWAA